MNKKALTMMEILVSALIMALVMAGLVNIFLSGKRYILHSRSWITAAELGRYFLDPLQMDVRQDQWGSNCLSAGRGCPGSEAIDNIEYTPTYNISNVSGTSLRKVKLTITWNEPTP